MIYQLKSDEYPFIFFKKYLISNFCQLAFDLENGVKVTKT